MELAASQRIPAVKGNRISHSKRKEEIAHASRTREVTIALTREKERERERETSVSVGLRPVCVLRLTNAMCSSQKDVYVYECALTTLLSKRC